MIHPSTPYGFRVLGSATRRRRIVNAAAALRGYSSLDERAETHRESYLSYYCFGDDFRRHYHENTGSTAGFDGICWAPFVWFDVDRPSIADALRDCRRLAASVLDRYTSLDEDDLLLFLSGSKGFHVGLPTSIWRPSPSDRFHKVTRSFAEGLAGRAGVRIDDGTFDKVRLFRAPNSRHPKTGLHKRRLAFEELMHLQAERIQQLAEEPETFDLPGELAIDERAQEDWVEAERQVQRESEESAKRARQLATGEARLTRRTLDFIRDGADEGDRHRLLFSAAANLAEFACPPELAHALLTEAGLNCGLMPKDVRRQIERGLNHGRDATRRGEEARNDY